MPEKIIHEGVVIAVEKNLVTVKIEAASACGSCHAKGLCNMAEKTDKEIPVKTSRASDYSVGEKVHVFLMSNTGLKAVGYAYGLSLGIGAQAFIIASFLTENQLIWGLSALAAIALYFIILRLCAPHLNQKFSFGVEKIAEPF
ncbi:MAG: SoxR reducing system RseC family protein [Bacteroidales bacterium]|nr:SoxR reducing system RseC family protein [Bacteroidales bacterium]